MNLAIVREWLLESSGVEIDAATSRPVSGGCIHNAEIVDCSDNGTVFLKSNRAEAIAMFEAEKNGLETILESGTIRVPRPFATAVVDGNSVLAMEGIDMISTQNHSAQRAMGEAIAALHRVASPDGKFGFGSDNYIGATPQKNDWSDSWAEFFTGRRLRYQFQLAEEKGRQFPNTEKLLRMVGDHLSELSIQSVLLHGDLWGGNTSFDETGAPIVFDPAVYFGDGETDIAFTRMFGGFGSSFYEAYREIHPSPEPVREKIYNLYHLLNHYNLFGGGYAAQAEQVITDLISEL